MSAVPLVEDSTQSIEAFAPLDTLFSDYAQARSHLNKIANFVQQHDSAAEYFFEAARTQHGMHPSSVKRFFDIEAAVSALDADYWGKVMRLTDILESMPGKARNEWASQLRKHETPAFTRVSVESTMNDLLFRRVQFFAERVDGIFRALSSEHVTNRPEGFGKRMIVNYVLDAYQFR